MGLKGTAAIAGLVELPPRKHLQGPPRFTLEHWALLSAQVIADAGIDPKMVDGIVSSVIGEAEMFVPSTIAEYIGVEANFAEFVDLGGASAAAAVWRAAVAVELGICNAVLCVVPGTHIVPTSEAKPPRAYDDWGQASNAYGSPQAEFEIPYGNLGQNGPYGQIARLYGETYGYDERAMAKIAVDQRTNACSTPDAVFYGKPITVDDVLNSPMIAAPLHMLEIVMLCQGGAAVLVVNENLARKSRNRPVWITGFGERVSYKTPTYAKDLLTSPMTYAADSAFEMAGIGRQDIDIASIYDCYTITMLMQLEDAGFCPKGEGMKFVQEHDLTFRGDFPVNTSGGQLSFGQAGMAGGMHHVCDAVRQLMNRAGDSQVPDANRAFVTGNGGIMSEQVALVLQGD